MTRAHAHILIVEDHDDLRCTLSRLVQSMGHVALTARDGAQAVACFERNAQVDLVLMDVDMPVLDGISATRRIRALEAGMHTPIVVLTGRLDADTHARALAAGATALLGKPAVGPELIEALQRHLVLACNPNPDA